MPSWVACLPSLGKYKENPMKTTGFPVTAIVPFCPVTVVPWLWLAEVLPCAVLEVQPSGYTSWLTL